MSAPSSLPETPEKLFRQGLEHFRDQRFGQALMCWEAVRRLQPSYPSIDMHINVADRQRTRSQLELESLEKSLVQAHGETFEVDMVEDARVRFEAALRDGKEGDAETELLVLLRERPGDPRSLRLAAEGFKRISQPHKMRELASRLVSVQEYSYRAHLLLGRAHLANEDDQAALYSFRQAQKLCEPPNATVLAHIGLAAINLSDWTLARESFEKALELKPDEVRFQKQLNLIQSEESALGLDTRRLLADLASMPDYPDVLWQRGCIYRRNGEHAKALDCFQRAVSQNPYFHKALYDLASLQFEQGDSEASARALLPLLEVEEVAESLNSNIQAFMRSGYFDEAAQDLLKALKVRPDYASMHIQMGRNLLEQEREKEAFEEFQKGVALAPEYADGQYCLGLLYAKRGELQSAREHFHQAWDMNPLYFEAALEYVRILVLEGENQKAGHALQRIQSCLSDEQPEMQRVLELRSQMMESDG